MTSRAASEFAAFERGFKRAVDAAGGIQARRIQLAGVLIELRFAGSALVESLFAPFRHQCTSSEATPDLVIQAWDSCSSGIELPLDAGDLEQLRTRGMPSVPPEDGFFAAYLRPDPGLSMLDLAAGRAVYWLPDAGRVPFEDRSGPFRGIANWWLTHRNRQFIHAAAVGTDDGAALIVGASGSGKSTAALACMLAGMHYLGDDYCLLEPGDPPRVHSLFLTAKLHGEHLARFPQLTGAVINAPRLRFEKGVLDLSLVDGVNVRRSLPIRAVLVPFVTNEEHTQILPLRRPAALAALAPSTMLQLASAKEESLRRMADVVRHTPAFQLRSGTVLEEIPEAVLGLLRSLSAGADGG